MLVHLNSRSATYSVRHRSSEASGEDPKMSPGLQLTGPEIDLPVEMMLQFFSYLDRSDDSDVKALIACSKVSRKWNAVVLPLLFSELDITFMYQDNKSQGDKFARDIHGGISYRHLALVFTSLQHTSRILPHVRKLHLRQKLVQHSTAAVERNFVDSEILGNVIRLFPCLTHLQLTNVRLRNRPEIMSGILSGSIRSSMILMFDCVFPGFSRRAYPLAKAMYNGQCRRNVF